MNAPSRCRLWPASTAIRGDRADGACAPARPAQERQLEDVSIGAAVGGALAVSIAAFASMVVGAVTGLRLPGKRR